MGFVFLGGGFCVQAADECQGEGLEVPVWILGLADLRRSKREAGRPKDLDDLDHLPQ